MEEINPQDLRTYHRNTLALLTLCIVLVLLMFAVGVRLGQKCSPGGGWPRTAGASPRPAGAVGAGLTGQ